MISILIPTRKRPEQLRQVLDTAQKTSVLSKALEFICYVDEDDTSYDEFTDITILRGPRIVLSNMWNKCAAVARGDIFMQGNDDIAFRTHGWDLKVENEFEKSKDKILMVHGDDGSFRASGRGEFGPHPFVHRKWYETLGYFTPPYFSSDYGDTWINDLANGINRRKVVPIVIEHLHFYFGKAVVDETTNDRLIRHSADSVQHLYEDLFALRQWDVERLKAVMQ